MRRVSQFDDFFNARYGQLVRNIFLTTGDLGRSQDCVQEAFIKAWQRWDSLENDDPVSWVQTVAWRLAVSDWRRRRVVQKVLARHGPIPDVDPPSEDVVVVQEVLSRLTQDHRTVLVLHYFADMTVQDIGRVLELSEGTVKSRLSRARDSFEHLHGTDLRRKT